MCADQTLRAGPFELIFQADSGFVRYIRLGGQEVVRGIYAAVRDPHWHTIVPDIQVKQQRIQDDSFEVVFSARCIGRGVDYRWIGHLSGAPDGEIEYRFDGEALCNFKRARIGFCVLHPPELAGQPCIVEDVDGERVKSFFPDRVSLHQPFFNVRAIEHFIDEGTSIIVRMEGETFEMEDQRNWTDASFKTYCTPLELPMPVEVSKGDCVSQRILIRATGVSPARPTMGARSHPTCLSQSSDVVAFPRIGTGWTVGRNAILSPLEKDLLRRLPFDYIRVELQLDDPTWAPHWTSAITSAASMDLGLEVVMRIAENDVASTVRLILQYLSDIGSAPKIRRWIVLDLQGGIVDATMLRSVRDVVGNDAPVGTGTGMYFTELNRNRPDPIAPFDFVAFSLNPQVHAFDNASIVETLDMQRVVIQDASLIAEGKGVVVSPITLRDRYPRTEVVDAPVPHPDTVDSRQTEAFGAVWTLGSLRAVSLGRAEAVTYYEIDGPRGLYSQSDFKPYPVHRALSLLKGFENAACIPLESTAPLEMNGMVLESSNAARVIVWNYLPVEQVVRVRTSHPWVTGIVIEGLTERPLRPPATRADGHIEFAVPAHGIVAYS